MIFKQQQQKQIRSCHLLTMRRCYAPVHRQSSSSRRRSVSEFFNKDLQDVAVRVDPAHVQVKPRPPSTWDHRPNSDVSWDETRWVAADLSFLLLNMLHFSSSSSPAAPEGVVLMKSFIQELVILLQSALFPFLGKDKQAFMVLNGAHTYTHTSLINIQEISTCRTKFIRLTFQVLH